MTRLSVLVAAWTTLTACTTVAGLDSIEFRPGGHGGEGGIADGSYASVVMADGPLGYWRLGDGVPPVAVDAMGQNDGTYLGDAHLGEPGLILGDDTAVEFAGGWVRVDEGFGFEGRAPFSVDMWVLESSNEAGCLMGKTSYSGGVYSGWMVISNSGGIRFDRHPGGAALARSAPLDQPFHLAVTFDGVTLSVYFDGERTATRTLETDLETHTEPLLIGSCDGWTPFSGTLDEVAIYDYVLTPAQIEAHVAAAGP